MVAWVLFSREANTAIEDNESKYIPGTVDKLALH